MPQGDPVARRHEPCSALFGEWLQKSPVGQWFVVNDAGGDLPDVTEAIDNRREVIHLALDTLARHRDQLTCRQLVLTCRQLVLTRLSASALASDLSRWQVAHAGWSLDL